MEVNAEQAGRVERICEPWSWVSTWRVAVYKVWFRYTYNQAGTTDDTCFHCVHFVGHDLE